MKGIMKVAGIIAEYNPFHHGHAHQIRLLKEAGFDYVVVVMSGDFVQRGAPAFIDKFTRTRMALTGGADLVLELPSLFAVSSAEYFAGAGVRILGALGCMDTLCFGYERVEEIDDADVKPLLLSMAEYLNQEPAAYQAALAGLLREGKSYPAARAAALQDAFPKAAPFLSKPNNILALEYTRAILRYGLSMKICPIPRTDHGYHADLTDPAASAVSASDVPDKVRFLSASDDSDTVCFLSAEGIRSRLLAGEPADAFIPRNAYTVLSEAMASRGLTTADDFSALLFYKLLPEKDFSGYADCSPALSQKLLKGRSASCTFSGLASLLKTKDLTYTRISRVLFNIMLDHRQEDLAFFSGSETEKTLYAKILGFRREAEPLFSRIKKSAGIPLVSKAADASALLSPGAFRLFSLDIQASKVYHLIDSERTKLRFPNDYEHPLEIL